MAIGKTSVKRIQFACIGLILGLVLGVIGTVFIQSFNPKDEHQLTASVVFDRIIAKNELVSASQSYNITDKAGSSMSFFELFDIPFTDNSFWYRYVGTIKAGVDLENADYAQNENVITVTLNQPYIISNTPNMDESGVMEERNNIFNPIHIEDVDAFQRLCIEKSETSVMEGDLMDEARMNAETDIRDMFNAALGDAYQINFIWREADNSETEAVLE